MRRRAVSSAAPESTPAPDGRRVADPFAWCLACAVLSPGLRSVLVLAPAEEALDRAGNLLAQLLRLVEGDEPVVVRLGTAETEDDLWGTLAVSHRPGEPPLTWREGRLAARPEDRRPRLVMVPDLARLSLPAQRAAVALIDAPGASLQRHGRDLRWTPRACWLATCDPTDVGQVSPHLLDRFALRLSGPEGHAPPSPAAVRAWAIGRGADGTPRAGLDARLTDGVRAAHLFAPPSVEEAARARMLTYTGRTARAPGARRDLALARLAVAHARLLGARVVTPALVDEAAALIGLPAPEAGSRRASPSTAGPTADVPGSTAAPSESAPPQKVATPTGDLAAAPAGSGPGAAEPVYAPDTSIAFESASAVGPYPEDQTPPTYEPEPLRLPLQRWRARDAAGGWPIGTRRATDADLRDLALLATLIEAAKFQAIRRAARPVDDPGPGLVLSVSDLRSYVRAPLPDQVLVIVLDYTCLAGRDWQSALLPHLRWAYQERAAIRLVQVGARGAAEPLRAELISAANVLALRLGAALEARAGSATPLAHGLDLAVGVLRNALQRGRASVQRARLVVVSDGRGNVPLAASRSGHLAGPIRREGVEDALAVARVARGQRNLQSVVLDPRPAEYPALPAVLAEALGASVEAIPEPEADGVQR